ncbi:TIGR02391 family protein [Streptomyces sp. NPDC048516]|uniref:TIGR02391 family protein n=1 Tax=Streptomyces sp. NPDC048516 TaxID=3365565 RepID=UPI00371F8C45
MSRRSQQALTPGAEGSSSLFAGAMGAYENPSNHRTIDFDDPIEAAEIIQPADPLPRQVERFKRRPSRNS